MRPRVLLSFHHTQLDRIDHCTAHPHVADDHHAVSGLSPLVLTQKLLGRCNRVVRTAREIDAGWKRSPIKRQLAITSSLGVKAKIGARCGLRFEAYRAILPCRVKTTSFESCSELASVTAEATIFCRTFSRSAFSA